jgi:hypothetical protein
MRKALVATVFVLGLGTGWLVAWVRTYSASRATDRQAPPISKILKSAAVTIVAANDHCESRLGHTVAEVFGGILDAGLGSARNPYSYSCDGATCRFEISNCTPWQKSDCGQTMLEFRMDGHGAPRPETFACLDIP